MFVIITMLAYVTSKLSASLYAGALILKVTTGLNLWQSIPLIIIATAVYTVAGGLTVGVQLISWYILRHKNEFL